VVLLLGRHCDGLRLIRVLFIANGLGAGIGVSRSVFTIIAVF
jgi:hypothetical protein